MTSSNSFITVKGYGEQEIIIKKSRFIGRALPVENEEKAIEFISNLRKKYSDATHHCYAYIIGANSGIMRYSDDGEPSGTAGIPILEVLKINKAVNLVVVVTRYFGGIMLGAGGLVRAYTKGSSIALSAAKLITMDKSTTLLLDIPYQLWDKIKYELERQPVQIIKTEYSQSVSSEILVKNSDLDNILKALAAWSEGKVVALAMKESFEAWDIKSDLEDIEP